MSVKPEFFRPRRKNLSGFFLYGKLDAFLFFSWTHSQVVSRSMADRGSERRRRHAGFRAGDEFYQTTQSPVHLALKCSEFSMHRVRKKEDACRHQKA